MKKELAARFTVSLPPGLLQQLDDWVHAKGFDNRSQAVADMIRDRLVDQLQESPEREIAGTITLVYDHHKPHLTEELTDFQHDHHHAIISTLHVHLDHHNCLEVLVVRGKVAEIQRMADRLLAIKGLKHGKLTVTTTGKDIPA
ncbi:MAG: nickel-responsive transcriptional regulator NikR [Verrucomicrobiae bacterium]|nr:nickel-responsive transcriptional regulator NikR [Verrucomicrobiae bacterium]